MGGKRKNYGYRSRSSAAPNVTPPVRFLIREPVEARGDGDSTTTTTITIPHKDESEAAVAVVREYREVPSKQLERRKSSSGDVCSVRLTNFPCKINPDSIHLRPTQAGVAVSHFEMVKPLPFSGPVTNDDLAAYLGERVKVFLVGNDTVKGVLVRIDRLGEKCASITIQHDTTTSMHLPYDRIACIRKGSEPSDGVDVLVHLRIEGFVGDEDNVSTDEGVPAVVGTDGGDGDGMTAGDDDDADATASTSTVTAAGTTTTTTTTTSVPTSKNTTSDGLGHIEVTYLLEPAAILWSASYTVDYRAESPASLSIDGHARITNESGGTWKGDVMVVLRHLKNTDTVVPMSRPPPPPRNSKFSLASSYDSYSYEDVSKTAPVVTPTYTYTVPSVGRHDTRISVLRRRITPSDFSIVAYFQLWLNVFDPVIPFRDAKFSNHVRQPHALLAFEVSHNTSNKNSNNNNSDNESETNESSSGDLPPGQLFFYNRERDGAVQGGQIARGFAAVSRSQTHFYVGVQLLVGYSCKLQRSEKNVEIVDTCGDGDMVGGPVATTTMTESFTLEVGHFGQSELDLKCVFEQVAWHGLQEFDVDATAQSQFDLVAERNGDQGRFVWREPLNVGEHIAWHYDVVSTSRNVPRVEIAPADDADDDDHDADASGGDDNGDGGGGGGGGSALKKKGKPRSRSDSNSKSAGDGARSNRRTTAKSPRGKGLFGLF